MSLLRRMGRVFRGRKLDLDLQEEIRAHLEMRTGDNIEAGMSAEQAREDAVRRFGNELALRENARSTRTIVWLETLLQDTRYGLRALCKSPGFSLVVIAVLALGIGAGTAIFSVVNAVLLRPLPYKDSDRLVVVLHNHDGPVAVANYLDWKEQGQWDEGMGAAESWMPNLTGVDPPEHINSLRITQSLFPMLGVDPLLGRFFASEEEQVGHEHVVILSYGLWQRRFAGDEKVLGRTIQLDGEPYTVVGVMPREFRFAPFWATKAELWAPQAFGDRIHNRGGNSLRVFARLKQGVTLEKARAEVAAITGRIERQYPNTSRGVTVTPLAEMVVGDVRPALLMMLGAVGFVLLIVCANVTHMLLARSASRQREVAVRTALGASRSRALRQFLTESLILTFAGAAAGLLLAKWGVHALIALRPAYIPRVETVGIESRVLLFAVGMSLLIGVLVGLAPAFSAFSINLTDALKEGGRGGGDGSGRTRLRGFLVASEFTLALMLLVGAGLMIRSFVALQSIDPGLNPHNVLSMVVSVKGSPESGPERRPLFYRDLLEKVRALPGVQSAGAINHLPLSGDIWGWDFLIEGKPRPKPGETPVAVYRAVMPGYFSTMRVPLLRGRDISAGDLAGSPGVVVVNEQTARTYWPGEDPIGKRVSFDQNLDDPASNDSKHGTWLTVIGVSKNTVEDSWRDRVYPEVYLALLQNKDYMENSQSHFSYMTLVMRSSGDPAAQIASIKNAVWSFNRNLTISDVSTMDEVVAEANAQPRFEMLLLGIFAAVALLLAAAGIYGVMSYAVSRRTHEIGIRLSLGASKENVLGLVVKQGMKLALLGSVAGVIGALAVGRLIAQLLFGVKPSDPLTFAVVVVTLIVVACAATYIPARRASRVDPMIALRHE